MEGLQYFWDVYGYHARYGAKTQYITCRYTWFLSGHPNFLCREASNPEKENVWLPLWRGMMRKRCYTCWLVAHMWCGYWQYMWNSVTWQECLWLNDHWTMTNQNDQLKMTVCEEA
jgi:hypothetical protein